jgi:hypothetical protein
LIPPISRGRVPGARASKAGAIGVVACGCGVSAIPIERRRLQRLDDLPEGHEDDHQTIDDFALGAEVLHMKVDDQY